MENKKKSIEMHELWKGKIEIKPRVEINSLNDLSLAYTPGVADACLEVKENPERSYDLTRRHNTIAVITDGTAVLGLGDIGPLAGMPVMEGKALLFKTFGDVDAIPLCIKSKDSEEIIRTICLLEDSFGGINLEDISAPRCFEIEQALKEKCHIPVFHDDQHGTAITVGAALLNACKLAKKKIDEIHVVINGAGAAGLSIADFFLQLGVKDLILCDKLGIIDEKDERFNSYQRSFAKISNPRKVTGTLQDAMKDSDVFVGVSGPNLVTKEMVQSMNRKAIVFPMANPVSEINYEDAKDAGAFIVGTGSSVYPNQINNVLAFPGIFRGALDAKAKEITNEMMYHASLAIARSVPEEKLSPDYILPYAFDKTVHQNVAKAVKDAYLLSTHQ